MSLRQTLFNHSCSKLPQFKGFDELYRKITDESAPRTLNHTVLPIDEYAKHFELFHQRKPNIVKKPAGYIFDTEFTLCLQEKQLIVVMENSEDFVFDLISHGIGHVKYSLNFYERENLDDLDFFTEYDVREVAALIATQKALPRISQNEYIKTRFYNTMLEENQLDETTTGFAEKLIQKYGINDAWQNILNIDYTKDLESLLK